MSRQQPPLSAQATLELNARTLADQAAAREAAEPYALAEYRIHRTRTALNFEPTLHLYRGMEIGKEYSVTVTLGAAEDVKWRVYGPPGNIHAGAAVMLSGGTKFFTLTPTVAGKYLIVVNSWVSDRAARSDLADFRSEMTFDVFASQPSATDATVSAIWGGTGSRTTGMDKAQNKGPPSTGIVIGGILIGCGALLILAISLAAWILYGRTWSRRDLDAEATYKAYGFDVNGQKPPPRGN